MHRLEMDAEQAAELKRRRVMLAISGRVKPSCYLDMKGVPEELLLGKKGDGASAQKGGDVSKETAVAASTNVPDQASNNTVTDPTTVKTDNTWGNKGGDVPHDNTVVISVSVDHCSTPHSPSSPLSRNPDTLHSDHVSSDSSVIEYPLSDSEENEEKPSLS